MTERSYILAGMEKEADLRQSTITGDTKPKTIPITIEELAERANRAIEDFMRRYYLTGIEPKPKDITIETNGTS